MAGTLLVNLGRVAKIVALILFLLPWVTVSCSGQALGAMSASRPQAQAQAQPQLQPGVGDLVLAKATGAQLATATVTLTNPNPNPSTPNPNNPFEEPDYGVIGGALLILLSLAAGFVLKGRQGALAGAAGAALAAALLCYAVLIQLPAAVHGAFAGAGPGGSGAPVPPVELAELIKVHIEIGFWLTIAALAAAVLFDLLALKRGPAAAA